MSVPFSNTNLRVPRGFGNILEGLAREVLREQPEDIPTFAAVYFATLLEQREESGIDPAEWGARLEDRFYNNHAFKGTANQRSLSSAEVTVNEDKVDGTESLENEDTITQPAQNSSSSPETPEASKDTEELQPQQSNEFENKAGEELVETDPESTTEIAYRGTADVDICAEELQEMEGIKKQGETGDVDDEKETEDKDIHTAELEATPKSSYHGLADIDVCAEELHSTLQDVEPIYENNEDSRDLTDVSLTGVSESPAPVVGAEELSESQDVLDTHDTLTLSAAESPVHIEQDSAKELNDIPDNEKPGALPAEEEGEVDDFSEDAQNTLSEMADTLFEEREGENSNVEIFDLNEEMERVSVPEETNTLEISTDEAELGIEKQEVKDSFPETEAMDKSLSSLGKVSLEDGSNRSSAEVGHFTNIPSEVLKENDDDYDCVNKSEVIDEGDKSADHHHCASETGMENEGSDNKEAGPMDTDAYILQTSFGASMEGSEGMITSNTSVSGTSAEEMKDKDKRIFQQDQPEFKDTTGSENQGANTMNEIEMRENLFHGMTTQEAEGASHDPVSEETQEDIEEQHASGTQRQFEETGIDIDQEEQSDIQKDISWLESEDEEVENPESKREQQEECSHPQEEEDIMDIPLDDPEANKAAAKIQAGFRGHMTRKKLKPGDKPGEEVSSSGEALNGSQGDTAGGSEGVETDDTSVPEQ